MNSIRRAENAADLEAFKTLSVEYLQWLQTEMGVDLTFEGIHSELENLPGCYSSPKGCMFLIFLTGESESAAIGCAAVRPLKDEPHRCELKRIFVKPEHRGCSLGRALLQACEDAAREMGYSQMMLETLDTLTSANALYQRCGFAPTAVYKDVYNPLSGLVCYEKELHSHQV